MVKTPNSSNTDIDFLNKLDSNSNDDYLTFEEATKLVNEKNRLMLSELIEKINTNEKI